MSSNSPRANRESYEMDALPSQSALPLVRLRLYFLAPWRSIRRPFRGWNLKYCPWVSLRLGKQSELRS